VSTAARRKTTRPATVPANGQPVTFPEQIEHEALAFRAQGTALGAFLAEQLERIAGLARFLQAATPAEFYDRQEVEEDDLRTHWYDLGRQHEREDAQQFRTFGPAAPPIPIDERHRHHPGSMADPDAFPGG
jgi:hypothetical protein